MKSNQGGLWCKEIKGGKTFTKVVKKEHAGTVKEAGDDERNTGSRPYYWMTGEAFLKDMLHKYTKEGFGVACDVLALLND
ncbi:hypothetical protein FRX31_014190 [Thalictrum thalictroides]|uniref:Uncharacterized protein n=1 Tax=Thalictrum thalictroides TaxID=46969 RepID=A0A7J6WIG4_THATH|nr:hypothetical protein FRX31_014190 [Thalictrum thalictroides]